MSKLETAAIIGMGAAATALLYYGFVYPGYQVADILPLTPLHPDNDRVTTVSLSGGLQLGATPREAFIANTRLYQPPPADLSGYRQIPIVQPTQTLFSTAQLTSTGHVIKIWQTRAGYLDWLTQARAFLQAADRGDEDVRCILARPMIETLWGVSCWNYNSGNRKARPYCTPDMVRAGYVYTQSQWAQNFFLLIDSAPPHTLAGYYGYPSFVENWEAEAATLDARYPGCRDAFRSGDIAGLLAGAAIQVEHNYKDTAALGPAGVLADAREMNNYWSHPVFGATVVLGDDWKRTP